MGNLGTKIAEDIRNKFHSGDFTNKVVGEAGKIHVQSIKKLSKSGRDASGTSFFPLDQVYAKDKKEEGGSGEADLYSAGSDHALDDIFDDPVDNEFGVEFESEHQEDYMGAHQIGGQARDDFADMPVRKWFPTEEDKDSTPQKRNIEKIEEIVEQFFNESRTIKVREKVT